MAEGTIETAQADIEFATEIIARLEENLRVPLRGIVMVEDSVASIRRNFRAAVQTACLAMAEREHAGNSEQLAAARATILGVTDAQNIIPTILVDKKNLASIRGYEGDQLSEYVKSVVNKLALINEGEKPEIVVLEILGAGLVGFGGAFAYGVIKGLVLKKILKEAVLMGVKAAGGVAAVVGVVAVIVLELLIYFLHGNKKDFVGIIFNNSDENLVVDEWREGVDGADKGGLYMAHGYATGFMEVHLDGELSKPAVQLPSRALVGGEEDTLINGGIYSASKNFGLRGSEGVFVLHPLANPLPRIAVLFECPYFEDNGVNVAIDATVKSAKTYYDELDGSRGIDKSASGQGLELRARVGHPRGGDALGIAVLDQT